MRDFSPNGIPSPEVGTKDAMASDQSIFHVKHPMIPSYYATKSSRQILHSSREQFSRQQDSSSSISSEDYIMPGIPHHSNRNQLMAPSRPFGPDLGAIEWRSSRNSRAAEAPQNPTNVQPIASYQQRRISSNYSVSRSQLMTQNPTEQVSIQPASNFAINSEGYPMPGILPPSFVNPPIPGFRSCGKNLNMTELQDSRNIETAEVPNNPGYVHTIARVGQPMIPPNYPVSKLQRMPQNPPQGPNSSINPGGYTMPGTPPQPHSNTMITTSMSCVQNQNMTEPHGLRNTRTSQAINNSGYNQPTTCAEQPRISSNYPVSRSQRMPQNSRDQVSKRRWSYCSLNSGYYPMHGTPHPPFNTLMAPGPCMQDPNMIGLRDLRNTGTEEVPRNHEYTQPITRVEQPMISPNDPVTRSLRMRFVQQNPHVHAQASSFSLNSGDYAMPGITTQPCFDPLIASSMPHERDSNVVEPRRLSHSRRRSEVSPNPPYIPPVRPTPSTSYSVTVTHCTDPKHLSNPAPNSAHSLFSSGRNPSLDQSEQVPSNQTSLQNVSSLEFASNDWVVQCRGIQLEMKNSELWKRFDNLVLEMVIGTKPRNFFPILDFKIAGLNPSKLYTIYLDFVNADDVTWKFNKSSKEWCQTANSVIDDLSKYNERVFLHPNSPAKGDMWNNNGIKFKQLHILKKLTNPGDEVCLKTMHRYIPRLIVVEAHEQNLKHIERVLLFVMVKTQFIVVSQYYCDEVRRLKTELNPNAKSARHKLSGKVAHRTPTKGGMTSSVTQPQNDVRGSSNQLTSERLQHEPSTSSNYNETNEAIAASTSHNTMRQSIRFAPYPRGRSLTNGFSYSEPNRTDCQEQSITMHPSPVPEEDLDRVAQYFQQQQNFVPAFNQQQDQDRNELNPTSGTVHYFPPGSADMPTRQSNVEETEEPVNFSLSDCDLLNLDRCLPSNVTAPENRILPFDKDTLLPASEASGASLSANDPIKDFIARFVLSSPPDHETVQTSASLSLDTRDQNDLPDIVLQDTNQDAT